MATRSDTKEEQSRPGSTTSLSSTPIDNIQTPGISHLYPECVGREQGKEEMPESRNQPQQASLSSISETHTDENEQMVITSIRATDVALGLRRVPTSFYAVVHHSGLEWRTENKHSLVNDDVVGWTGPIPIPSDLSASVCVAVYASYELQPMLGAGEQLRKLTMTVEQLLDRSSKDVPFILFPKDGDVVSPCSSIFLIIERRKRESSDSPASRILGPHCSTTESREELEDATNQGHSALSRYGKHGGKQDLEDSIQKFERTLSICPLDHPCHAIAQSNLATAKFIHRQVDDTYTSLEVPPSLYRNVLAPRPAGSFDRPSTLIQLATVDQAQHGGQGNRDEGPRTEVLLYEVIEVGSTESHEKRAPTFLLQLLARRGVGSAQADSQSSVEQDSASRLMDEDPLILGQQLLRRFQRFGDLADLQQAITFLEELARSTPGGDDRYREGLAYLGLALRYRSDRLGELNDLEEAILRQRDVVDLTPHGHPDRLACLGHLGNSFLARFQRLGELSDLEDAISRHRIAVDLTPRDHPGKSGHLHNLGNCFKIRFERLGELRDLEDAILALKEALDLAPHGHPDRPARLYNLGGSFLDRFERFGKPSDLEDAISTLRDAVDLIPHDHPHKPAFMTTLGSALKSRFKWLGELNDLEEAILRHRDAANLIPHGHSYKSTYLNNLGNSFLARFDRLGELSDLEDAISRHRDAVDLTPYAHTHKSNHLSSLGNSFKARFQHLGELSDIEDAISRHRDAVDLTPHDHPDMPSYLNNLGNSFKARFRRSGEMGDLEDAILRHRSAVDLIPHGHPDKPGYLNNLGNSFRARFEHLGELSDIEDAISALRDAVDLVPRGHSDKPGLLNNLGYSFVTRFGYLGELCDLEEAISRYRDAVDLAPRGHLDKPACLNNLGNSFVTRFEHLGELSDLEQAISLYSHAASATGPLSIRFDASQKWILCARHIRHHSLLHAYSVAIALLPQLAWIGLSLTHRYHQLTHGADVVREAAAAALDSGLPETAVEWLEQGRSIVWGELFQLRSSYEELSSAHPDHAHRLRVLSTALEHASSAREKSLSSLSEQTPGTAHRWTESLQQESDRHRMLAIERDKLLQEIRGLPGFERFLLHKQFSQLCASAHSGPVVILNAAKSRCDALIVLADVDHVIHVPLPNFTFQRSKGLQNMLERLLGHARVIPCDDRKGDPATRDGVRWESLLSTLWNDVVKPVLDALAFSTLEDISRIFWCPTGPFVFLPIHAAGLYDPRYSQRGHKVFDFLVSSYVPTLSILALSPNPGVVPRGDLRFLAVHQPSSDGLSQLPGVATELEYIRAVIKNSPSTHTTLLESSVGTVEEVFALMKEADWVHFACHGIQDASSPTDSGLCLADGRRLKLRDIIALSRPRGGLAFLSACQTAMGDERLSDEAIHIAAGMLFAGYGGVIGTMWSISDRLAPGVARDVYEQLFRNGTRPDCRDAARALHEAIGHLRDRSASFVEWLPFIHVGI